MTPISKVLFNSEQPKRNYTPTNHLATSKETTWTSKSASITWKISSTRQTIAHRFVFQQLHFLSESFAMFRRSYSLEFLVAVVDACKLIEVDKTNKCYTERQKKKPLPNEEKNARHANSERTSLLYKTTFERPFFALFCWFAGSGRKKEKTSKFHNSPATEKKKKKHSIIECLDHLSQPVRPFSHIHVFLCIQILS